MEVKISISGPISPVQKTNLGIVDKQKLNSKKISSNSAVSKKEKLSANLKLKENKTNSESLPEITEKLVLLGIFSK